MAGGDLGCEALSCRANPGLGQLESASSHSRPSSGYSPPHPCSAPVPPPISSSLRGLQSPAGGERAQRSGVSSAHFHSHSHTNIPVPKAGVGLGTARSNITQASCLQGSQERHGDFPGGAVCKNPPASAGTQSLNPWPGQIPHQLQTAKHMLHGPRGATTETPRA